MTYVFFAAIGLCLLCVLAWMAMEARYWQIKHEFEDDTIEETI